MVDDNLKNMGRFSTELLLEDNTWHTRYTLPKNGQYSNTSTEWKLLNLDFNEENYGIKLTLDQIDTAHSDMCLSHITITHSINYLITRGYKYLYKYLCIKWMR